MSEEKFNLLDEKWIKVLNFNLEIETVSLKDIFGKAHLYQSLVGDVKTQETAMLRFLLAIVHTVVSRYELEGQVAQIEDVDDALDRWESYWNNGKFDSEVFNKYLEIYRDRFWLFHPKYPFWQTEDASKATSYPAAKLIPDLLESNHKDRWFQNKSLDEKKAISYEAAARNLILLNSYDDAGVKPTQKGLPSVGVGWLGKSSQIYALGDNLFETLMLNCILLRDGKGCWPEDKPRWELILEPSKERNEISGPNNLAALYTISSRRIFLKEENGKVTGFNSMGGDFFEAKNYFIEQNTLWQEKSNKDKSIGFVPKKIPKNRQLWIEFANTFMETTLTGSKIHQPGLILWIQRLRSEDLLSEEKIIEFATVSAYYDSNNSSIIDITGDTLSIHTSLLETLNEVWRKRISEEIDKCAKLAEFVGELSENITLASYRNIESQGANQSKKKKSKKSQYYEKGEELTYLSINEPFKRWIESLDPKLNNYDYFALEWHKTIRKIAKKIENELCNGLPIEGYIGRKIVDKNVEGKIMSVPIAQRIYWAKLNKLYPGKEG